MSIAITSRDGRFEVRFRSEPGSASVRVTRVMAVGAGLLLLAVLPAVGFRVRGFAPALVVAAIASAVVAWKLLAEASRRERLLACLHIAAGELEIRSGRWPFRLMRAFGAVEVDRVRLARTPRGKRQLFSAYLIVRSGPPVELVWSEPDESACREVALVVSQGMAVPLEDRRYPGGLEEEDPPRVARLQEDRLTVLCWDARDRLRPRACLVGLGAIAALFSPLFADRVPPLASILLSVAVLAIAVAILVHVLAALSSRRVTLRPDAVRVERRIGGVPLFQRLILYEDLKAVVVRRRLLLAAVHFRVQGRSPGPVLPFEEPALAGWLKSTVERAAHACGQRRHPAGARPMFGGES